MTTSPEAKQAGSASNRSWGKSECFVCGKFVSTCGLGYVSHMRKHVRQGKVEEQWSEDGKHKEFNWSGRWLDAKSGKWKH